MQKFTLLFVLLLTSITFGEIAAKKPVSSSPAVKPKIYYNFTPMPPPAPEEFSAIITAGTSSAWVMVPKSTVVKKNLVIRYQLSGIGLAAVEVTAFENPGYLNRWVYTTSAFPKEMKIAFNYLGSVQAKKSGEYPKKAVLKFTDRFSSGQYYRLFFEIRNIGRTMLKSRGFGKLGYRLDVVRLEEISPAAFPGTLLTPKTATELYPGDKQEVSYLIDPLPPGKYNIILRANWNETQTVAETVLPITVVNEETTPLGSVIPETLPHPEVEMFSKTVLELQEPQHAFRIHELKGHYDNSGEFVPDNVSGLLLLSMPEKDCPVIIRLLTPYRIATATVTVTIENPKKKKPR